MRRMHWSALMLVVLIAGLAAPAARSDEKPALAGLYLCEGTDHTGSEYRGFVQIAGNRNTLILTWMFPDGAERGALRPSAVGVGIANGGSLSVSYYSGTVAGLVVYRIEQESQRLVGEWTVAGGDGILYSEILTKLAVEVTSPGGDGAPQPPKKPTRARRGTVAL
jgi:hypothetical protein